MAEISDYIYSNNMLQKIRSHPIIMKIFDNLKKIKLLDIFRYNKKYQKKMKIKLKDYKNEFSKIVIEIIPEEKKYGKFITVDNKHIKSNIHIYFNDNKEEIERKYIEKNDNVKKIKIIINNKIKSLSKLFYSCECIKKLTFIKFNIDNINDMSNMFFYCSELKELNLSNFITDKVTNMSYMFCHCSSLKELILSNFSFQF